MTRRLSLCVCLGLCLPLATALAPAGAQPASSARAATVSLPAIFHRVLPAVKRRTHVPVYLPGRAPSALSARHLFPTGGGSRRAYDLELVAGRKCGSANACFVGAFSGRRGGKPVGRPVGLTGGARGYFTPSSCGASCSPPEIAFLRRGVLYSFQYRSGAPIRSRRERTVMVGLANSALRAGPR